EHLLVGTDAEDDRLGILPVTVQVKDSRLVLPEHPYDAGAVPPRPRPETRALLDQRVVVRRRDGNIELLQRGHDLVVLRLEPAYGLAQPPPVLAAGGRSERLPDLVGYEE